MIERVMHGRDRFLNVAVVHQLALGRIPLSFDDHLDAEGMPMHAAALVAIGEAGQVVGGFEAEALGESDMHARSVGNETGRLAAACVEVSGVFRQSAEAAPDQETCLRPRRWSRRRRLLPNRSRRK